MKLDYLSTYTKINYKWNTDFKVMSQTLKLLERKHFKTGIGKNFLDKIPTAHEIKPTKDKQDLKKLKGSV